MEAQKAIKPLEAALHHASATTNLARALALLVCRNDRDACLNMVSKLELDVPEELDSDALLAYLIGELSLRARSTRLDVVDAIIELYDKEV